MASETILKLAAGALLSLIVWVAKRSFSSLASVGKDLTREISKLTTAIEVNKTREEGTRENVSKLEDRITRLEDLEFGRKISASQKA